jgi:hypothetical protein
VKRTHPFASENIDGMKESQIKKARELDEAEARRASRIEKQNEKLNKEIKKAEGQRQKAAERVAILQIQLQNKPQLNRKVLKK